MADNQANLAMQQGDNVIQAPFALAPALVSHEPVDYSTSAGTKLFKNATEPLSIEFDCTSENLQLFLDQLRDRAIIYDWLDILLITREGDEAQTKDLIESYGEISYVEVKTHAMSYVNTETREAQNSIMLYHCIMNSLSKDAQRQVRTRGKTYPFMIGGKGSGTLLLKVVVMVSHIDTRATISWVRTKMSSLDKYMSECDSDINKFNEYVIELVNKLQARGEVTQDLLINLFKGYKACRDHEFVEYIKKKEDLYEEGGDVSHEQLMDWALNKFKTRKENELWCTKSDEEETIIALQAQVQKLMSNKDKKNKKESSKDKKKKGKKGKGNDKPAWRKVPPKDGDKKSKSVDGKEWHWCPKHEAWVMHKPSECKGLGFRPGKDNADAKAADDGETPKKGDDSINGAAKLKLAKALASLAEEE